ncbi:MAG: electron transfer flavoprotein subunit alpha [Bacteroidetes bacterium]|nr:electron transfer flavoprotein subunit alpha [Bacteroidota bacterium]
MSVLVYTENWDGKFKKLSFELISYANEMAKQLGTEVIALSIGNVEDVELKSLGAYGAAKVVSVNDDKLASLENQPYAGVIAEVAAKEAAKVVLLANNNAGKAIAPRLSVKMKAGVIAGATEVPSSYDPFTVKKKVFTGKALANVVVKSDVKIVTLAQNSFGLVEDAKDAAVEAFDASVEDVKTAVKETNKVTGKVLLNDAEVVIAGGRGLKGPENFGPVEELAELLGGATACSRPVSDEDWRPHSEHVGQTGKIIAPNLYFAFGISGAIQHLGGVSSSKVIVAVNTDKDAPIFEAADYGIIGDAQKILPELIDAIKAAKAE